MAMKRMATVRLGRPHFKDVILSFLIRSLDNKIFAELDIINIFSILEKFIFFTI